MNERDALMRAAALCRGVSGRLHTDLMECKPGSTTARTLADMESGALHCIRKIEDAILALPETPRPEAATNKNAAELLFEVERVLHTWRLHNESLSIDAILKAVREFNNPIRRENFIGAVVSPLAHKEKT